jgi:hypothetical protein
LHTSLYQHVKARRPVDACKALGNISRSTLYRRIADRSLVAKKIGGITLITEESINALLATAPNVGTAG